MIFSGKPAYATRKLRDLQRRGYVIVKVRQWPDGSATYVMEYVGKKHYG